MRRIRQTALSKSVALDGVGLHTGGACRVVLKPAPADAGIRFICLNENDATRAIVAARAENVFDTRLGTSLKSSDGCVARTVEHLMAAAALAGVDNLDVEIYGGELPILDGSAAPFVKALVEAGLREIDAVRTPIRVTAPFELRDGDRFIRATPFDGRVVSVSVAFDDAAIGRQAVRLDLDDPQSIARLSAARTFCRRVDIDAMRAAGLSLGGSLENAIVVEGDRILNEGGLRDSEEFALHKALDLVGDLALAGAPLLGLIEAERPGHDLNVRFVRALLAGPGLVERASPGRLETARTA